MPNRDLYLGIAELMGSAPARDLEEYLRALLPLLRAHSEGEGLAGPVFLRLLGDAFTAPALPYDRRGKPAMRPSLGAGSRKSRDSSSGKS